MKPRLTVIAYVNVIARQICNKISLFIPIPHCPISVSSYANPARLLLLILLCCSNAQGTVIVVIIMPDRVVIGSDSKRLILKDGIIRTNVAVCKIHHIAGVFIAVAGANSDVFEPSKIAKQVISSNLRLDEIVARFQAQIETPLIAHFRFLKKHDLARYRASQQGGAVSITFIRFENDFPTVIPMEFWPIDKPDGQIGLGKAIQPSPTKEQLPVFTSVGISKRADQMEQSKGFWNKGPVWGVRKLIEISIEDRKVETGPPIHILSITKAGACWAEPEESCDRKLPQCPNDSPK